ncbi:MAG: PQQ-binding-like beta-propeller repeat protein [Planctomycetota bacterium]
MPRNLAIALAALLLLSGTLAATDKDTDHWSRFRGPNGSGIAESGPLPTVFGPDENVVWKVEMPLGHSSPVLWGERLFLTGVEDEALLTICLNRETGEELWRREAKRERVTKVDERNNAASPSPAVDGDVVVVFFPDSGLVAYDLEGKELWRHPLGPFNNLYGMGASPIVVGSRVVLPCDQQTGSFLIALDKQTGKVLWKQDRPWARSGHCTPILTRTEDGKQQILLPGSFFLDAYDAETGARVWWVGGLCFEMKSVPVMKDGILYINGFGSPFNQPGRQITVKDFEEQDTNGDGQILPDEMPEGPLSGWFDFVDLAGDKKLDEGDWSYLRAALASQNGLLAIRVGGQGDCTEKNTLWAYRRGIPQLPSPLLIAETLYLVNDSGGLATTLDPESGEAKVRGRLKAQDNYYASPVAADGKIYIASESGLVSVLSEGQGFEALAVNELGEGCYATPAIADGRLYIRTTGTLYCFGRTSGE